ncbi:MAG: FAD:protein FMN transferase [Armatimonadota bacterium]|nr:FAD:protein FMN transferase [Armatimonadota bacterium]
MEIALEKLEAEISAFVRLSRRAMGCIFELVLGGSNQEYLIDAGEEALDLVEALELQLSVFLPDSEISYINASAAKQAVRVEPRLYKLLKLAAHLSNETGGAFDITSGLLVKLWGFAGGRKIDQMPSDHEIQEALNSTGIKYVCFDDESCAVQFVKKDLQINLGALGKGYAVDEMVSFLIERGVTNGLISAGTSTVYGLGSPPGEPGWKVGIRFGNGESKRLATVSLKNQALSTSGGYEQYVDLEGRRFSHIVDPRTGWPASELLSASAVTCSATISDALSTAFFVLGIEGTCDYCTKHKDVEAILATNKGDVLKITG